MKTTHLAAERITVELTEFELTALAALVERGQLGVSPEQGGELEIHRAIANYNNLRLEHSTTILGRRGDPMEKAIVLDPWRKGGVLFWEIVEKDTRYNWTPRDEVFAWKRAQKDKKQSTDTRKSYTSATR